MAACSIALACIYIGVSNYLINELEIGPVDLAIIELIKDLLYVLLAGLVMYFGMLYLLKRIARQSIELERQRASILMLDQHASSGLLASAIGHDANNLLAVIRMSVDLLIREHDEETLQKRLRTISDVVEELSKLNLRLVKRGQSKQPGELREYCLKNEIVRVLSLLDGHNPAHKISITYSGMIHANAEVNRHLFTQVIVNLLANVARHAGENAKVEIHFRSEADDVIMEVHDNGPGIPEDKRLKIFEPYYSEHPDGSGLGLASVNAIMKMHHGAASCGPSHLGGACFTLRFPKNHVVGNSAE